MDHAEVKQDLDAQMPTAQEFIVMTGEPVVVRRISPLKPGEQEFILSGVNPTVLERIR